MFGYKEPKLKFIIQLWDIYGNLCGYLHSISVARQMLDSTRTKEKAKRYSSIQSAEKDVEKAMQLTCGGLQCRVAQYYSY